MQQYKSDLFYCKATLHVSGVTAPIISNTKNCKLMGAVTPETFIVTLQWNKSDCILLHVVGLLFNMNYDARNHELKILQQKVDWYMYCCYSCVLEG